jgi:hypothetical protein
MPADSLQHGIYPLHKLELASYGRSSPREFIRLEEDDIDVLSGEAGGGVGTP